MVGFSRRRFVFMDFMCGILIGIGHLKNEWLNEKTADNPESRFFRSRNPGHTQGDELVCLTLLEPDNLRSFALRGFTQGLALGAL